MWLWKPVDMHFKMTNSSSLRAALKLVWKTNQIRSSGLAQAVLIHVSAFKRPCLDQASTESDLYLGLFPELFPVDPFHFDFCICFLIGGALWEERTQTMEKM